MEIEQYYHAAIGVLGALFLASEALAEIPCIKANSVFQACQNFLKKVLRK